MSIDVICNGAGPLGPVTLGQAILEWFSDQSVAECSLYGGWTIRAWGRIGKVLLFLSAATILFEVIGFERLNRWGLQFRREYRSTKLILTNAWTSRQRLCGPFTKRRVVRAFLRNLGISSALSLVIMGTFALGGTLRFDINHIGATLFLSPIVLFNCTVVISLYQFYAQAALTNPRLKADGQRTEFGFLVLGFLLDLLAS